MIGLLLRPPKLGGVVEGQQPCAELGWRVKQFAVGARRTGGQHGEGEW
jgi:hypothetical protein